MTKETDVYMYKTTDHTGDETHIPGGLAVLLELLTAALPSAG